MKIQVRFAGLRQSSWRELALRFGLGGAITVLVGLVAKEFGPIVGGLFLAFPSIFPASVTLVERHEADKKRNKGFHGTCFARRAAGADAAGAAMGTFGLMAFGIIVWNGASDYPAWIVLGAASLAWMLIAASIWLVRKQL